VEVREDYGTHEKTFGSYKMKMLDCFCGLGGASEGFHREGFECTGIEIDPKIANLYPYKVIIANMRDLAGENFRDYDVIWGSPPCKDFSKLPSKSTTKKGVHREWRVPKNPEEGLKNVHVYLNFIEKAKPKIWIMENVSGLCQHIHISPTLITHIGYTEKGFKGMKRAFWGNFPPFLMTRQSTIGKERISSPLKKWIRAKIPLACSLAFAKACKQKLVEA